VDEGEGMPENPLRGRIDIQYSYSDLQQGKSRKQQLVLAGGVLERDSREDTARAVFQRDGRCKGTGKVAGFGCAHRAKGEISLMLAGIDLT
jgi:hypothetical protein